jgi:hypothetical protein
LILGRKLVVAILYKALVSTKGMKEIKILVLVEDQNQISLAKSISLYRMRGGRKVILNT